MPYRRFIFVLTGLFFFVLLPGSPAELTYSQWREIFHFLGDEEAFSEVVTLAEVYKDYIQDIFIQDDDVVFELKGKHIFYRGGRMLKDARLPVAERFDPIFYSYSSGPLQTLPPLQEITRRASDFLDVLIGGTERAIRRKCRRLTFLDHKVFVHEICSEPLKLVERDIRDAASTNPEVKEFLKELKVIYSFLRRDVAGINVRSYHGYGLALDLVPRTFSGKHVYWRWSRVLNKTWYKTPWHLTPLNKRWGPPQAVITAFERHGFIWGGKWSRFDTVHFEYRPEILQKRYYRRDKYGIEWESTEGNLQGIKFLKNRRNCLTYY